MYIINRHFTCNEIQNKHFKSSTSWKNSAMQSVHDGLPSLRVTSCGSKHCTSRRHTRLLNRYLKLRMRWISEHNSRYPGTIFAIRHIILYWRWFIKLEINVNTLLMINYFFSCYKSHIIVNTTRNVVCFADVVLKGIVSAWLCAVQ